MGRMTAYEWREADPEFAAGWDRALAVGFTALEDEAARRAYEGVDEPVIYQGQLVPMMAPATYKNGKPKLDKLTKQPVMLAVLDDEGRPKHVSVKKYSDQLLSFLLRANGEKYRDNGKSEVKLSGSLELQHMGEDELSDEIERLQQELAVKGVSAQSFEEVTRAGEQQNSVDDDGAEG